MTRREGVDIVCESGAVATGPVEAAQAGADILERGGNAMDAAAAACLACAVMEPQAVDLGGYVLAAVVLDASANRVWSVDANTVAPAAATSDMFRILPRRPGNGINEREYGVSVEDDANVHGPLATGVPGFLGGVGAIWERWGRLPWPEIVAPARALVERGIPYSLIAGDVDFKREAIARFPATAAFLERHGETWYRPELAATLAHLAATGWHDFYTGELGRKIVDFVASQGGILTREDMAAFAPRFTDPCSATYRGAEVHTAIAPNGGFSVLGALAELAREPVLSSTDPAYWQTVARALIRLWSARLADSPPPNPSPHGTVHVAAADRDGNLVSTTISQGGLFGACFAVPGTGIILSHGMCRFDPRPGSSNSVGPGKRPLNNVAPLLIRLRDRDVAMGTRGGRRIVSVSVQMVQRIVDDGASPYQTATAPRIHTLTGDPLELSANFDPAIRAALDRSGFRTEIPDEVAGAAHGAELRLDDRRIRAGGKTWAAGI